MPASEDLLTLHCPYCHFTPPAREIALHIYSEDHSANVKKFKRRAEYRNRQQELPGFRSLPLPGGRS